MAAAHAVPTPSQEIHKSEPIPHTLFSNGDHEKGIKVSGWTISIKKAPIFNSSELERQIPFPEMFFGNNHLRLAHESGFSMNFNALDALSMVDKSAEAADRIKVSYSANWTQKSQAHHDQIKDVIKPYDWTYTTLYNGTLERQDQTFTETTKEGIDYEKLMRPDPILLYEDIMLYEDELGDNGSGILNIRMRAMPSCFYILMRFFLRVDNVLFRIVDTRIYHEYDSGRVIRETSDKEVGYGFVRSKLPKQPPWHPSSRGSTEDLSMLTDANWVSKVLDDAFKAGDPEVKGSIKTEKVEFV
ncbi:hypothetical protein HDV05_005836 [Chytridiales sp. JEL 0842]|nr:hypothetical protein HDV05_005836 [Chytridiales sp. JEL 0842]